AVSRLPSEGPYLSTLVSVKDPSHRRKNRLDCRLMQCRTHSHSIISSARSRMDVGTDTPIALAVFRLRGNSKLVGCSTGKSDGFAPLRILATNDAARRNIGTVSIP